MAILHSVNVGTAKHIPGYKPLTGIVKQPVSTAQIERLGMAGDAICDRKHHGGVDQAVYLYFADDYAWWSQQLGHALEPGLFGENLTIAGVEGRMVGAGDRFVIGKVELEVTAHRMPCSTLAKRMSDPMFVKAFLKAGRPGAYCRVITPGIVAAGDSVIHTPFAGEPVSVAEMMVLDKQRDTPPDVLRRALAAPIHYKMRADFEQRLARLF